MNSSPAINFPFGQIPLGIVRTRLFHKFYVKLSDLFIYKDRFGIEWPMNVDISFKQKQKTKRNYNKKQRKQLEINSISSRVCGYLSLSNDLS